MKSNINRGSGFRGVLNYLLDEGEKSTGEKESEIIGGNMTGHNARSLTTEFSAIRKSRSDIRNPVWHCSLSLPPGERLTDTQWSQIATRFMELMKLSPTKHQYVAIRHHDCDHDHIHILSNRINLAGEVWYGRFELYTGIRATQQLEHEFGLTLTPGLWGEDEETGQPVKRQAAKKRPKKKEIEHSIRTEKAPNRLLLQEIVDEALKSGTQTIFSFMEQIEAAGAVAIPNVARTGRMNGFAFSINEIRFKGRDLGAGYTWKQLQQRGVSYEQDRDSEQLIKRAGDIKKTLDEINSGVSARSSTGTGAHDQTDQSDATGDSEHQLVDVSNDRRHPESDNNRPGRSAKINTDTAAATSHSEKQRQQSDNTHKTGRKDPTNSDASKQHQEMDRTPDTTLDWRTLAGSIADLAAPAAAEFMESSSSHQAKLKAWHQQHSALQAEHYLLTAISRTDPKKPVNSDATSTNSKQLVSAAEIADRIPELRRLSAQGHDIHITPTDKRYHFIIIDHLNNPALKRLRHDGYQPCLIQTVGTNSSQAVIKVPRESDTAHEQSLINTVSTNITKTYGFPCDETTPQLSMAGLAKQKSGSRKVITKVIQIVNSICNKTKNIMEQMRRSEATRKKKQHAANMVKQQIDAIVSGRIKNPDDSQQAFIAHWQEIYEVEKLQKGLKYAQIDYQVCLQMLRNGWTEIAVTQALTTLSPVLQNPLFDLNSYVRQTTQKAINTVSETQRSGNMEQDGNSTDQGMPSTEISARDG